MYPNNYIEQINFKLFLFWPQARLLVNTVGTQWHFPSIVSRHFVYMRHLQASFMNESQDLNKQNIQ